jgi:hypothetical protein
VGTLWYDFCAARAHDGWQTITLLIFTGAAGSLDIYEVVP